MQENPNPTSPFNSIFTFLTVPPSNPARRWDAVLSWALAALFFAVALLPDARLVRTKLLALETGVWAVSLVFLLRMIWRGELRLSNFLLLAALASWAVFVFALVRAGDNRALGDVEVRRALLMLGAFWTADQSLGLAGGRRRILAGWGLGAGLIALYGILQYSGGAGPVAVPRMDRSMGTFGNPIFFGTYLAMSLPLVGGLWLSAERGREKILWMAVFGLGAWALFLTRSRAAWIGFGVSLAAGLFILYGRRRALWAALGVLAVVSGVFVWRTRDTWTRDQAHMMIWRDTVGLWKTAPLLGVGPGEFHVHFPDVAGGDLKSKWPEGKFIVNFAHNEYLQVLAETGLIGLAFWLALAALFFAGQVLALSHGASWPGASPGGAPRRIFTKPDRFSVAFPDLDPERAAVFCAVAAAFAQALFSVDLRFSVSAGLLFFLMGSAASRRPLEFYWRASLPLRTGAALAALCLFAYLGAGLLRPYRAQREEARSVSFFDRKLLEPARTIADLEALAAHYPNEPLVWEKLGYACAKEIKALDEQGRPVLRREMADKSIAAYERVTRLFPSRPGPYNNLGNIYFTLGDRERALGFWRQAVAVDPRQTDARLNLGKVFYQEGKLKEASSAFQEVLEIDPANAEAAVYLRKMVE